MAIQVLVVEDKLNWHRGFRAMLPSPHYQLKMVFDPLQSDPEDCVEEARRSLENEHFDLAIVNINLLDDPEIPEDGLGIKVLELIKRDYPRLPRIVITGKPSGSVMRKYSPFDVDDVLIKSKFTQPQLVEAVQLALERRRSENVMEHDVHAEQKIDSTETRRITWLHLSDLHFRQKEYAADVVLDEMLADIEKQVNVDGLCPSFVIVTGDIAFSGLRSEYVRAADFFDRMLAITKLQKERLFVVPGNHDVHWKSIKRRTAAGFLSTLGSVEDVDNLLASPQELRSITVKFPHYRRFARDYLPHQPFDADHFSYVETLTCAGKRISILGLNSAWMSAYKWLPENEGKKADDRHNLILGRKQLRDAINKAEADGADLILVAMHHPTDWLRSFDQSHIDGLLARKCHFLLHGHLHGNQIVGERTPDGGIIRIMAGASFLRRTDGTDYNGYNFVQLNLSTNKGVIFLRSFSPSRGGFWTEDNFSYPNIRQGQYTFDLPTTWHI